MKKLLLILMLCGLASGAPVASFTVNGKTISNGRITVNKGETVCFTNTSTGALSYVWDFGDGGDSSAATNPCHTFRNAGEYTIKLKASNKKDTLPLLTGMTPDNYTLPDGWTLGFTQNFESGSVSSNEYNFGSITTNNPHTGSRSSRALVWKDDCATGWRLNQGVINAPEVYFSWYEYIDRQGKNNDEIFLFYIRKNFTSPTSYLGIRWQYLNNLGNWNTAFNLDSGKLVLFCEGDAPGATPSRQYHNTSRWMSFGQGAWRQWEVYWRPCTGGLKNGETKIYLNGMLKSQVKDTAFNGSVDMSGSAIYLGGTTYTKIIWASRQALPRACSQNVYELDSSFSRPKDFKWPVRCENQAPPSGYVPKFYRYIDDIIILQRGN